MSHLLSLFQKLGITTPSFRDCIEILLIIALVYYCLKYIRGTRMWIVAKGIAIFFVCYGMTVVFELPVIQYLFQIAVSFMTIALVVVFQPEIRKSLESLGTKNVAKNFIFKKKKRLDKVSDKSIDEIIEAVYSMSKVKTGALIAIENNIPLEEYIETGIPINADISRQILINIFEHNTPLHDGAVVIRNNKIVSATCYFPLSENAEIKKEFGTRHRSAIGLSEVVDAPVIIVSEETGYVSLAYQGIMRTNLTKDELKNALLEFRNNKQISLEKDEQNKRFITKTKLISIGIGFIIWLALINIINPNVTKEFQNIPVKVENDNVITDMNKSYEITDGNVVTVEISGRRSIINQITSDNINATANFSKLSIANAVPITVSTDIENITVNIIGNDVMNVSIDDTSEMECPVVIQKIGSIKDTYFANISYDVQSITVKGPKKTIKTIDKAYLVFDQSQTYEEPSAYCKVVLYDKNGTKMNLDNLTLSENEIKINFERLSIKEVPIAISAIDKTTGETYNIDHLITDIQTIKISGYRKKLNTIDEINIKLDMSNSTSNKIDTIINIENYLPEGIYLASDENNIETSFTIDKYITESISIPKNDIEITGNENMIVSIKDDMMILDITYDKSLKDVINYIHVELDVSDLDNGTYTIQPTITTDSNITIENIPSVNVEIKEM